MTEYRLLLLPTQVFGNPLGVPRLLLLQRGMLDDLLLEVLLLKGEILW